MRGTTSPYSAYVGELALLAQDVASGSWRRIEGDVSLALNGQASERLRQLIPLTTRRTHGAFFTTGAVRTSFSKVLQGLPSATRRFWDPSCGAGDLLLAASDLLPLGKSTDETLAIWSRSLRGSDLQPEFVAAARLRLFLAAAHRTRAAGAEPGPSDGHLRSNLLRSLRVEDGLAALHSARSFTGSVLLNPPLAPCQPIRAGVGLQAQCLKPPCSPLQLPRRSP